MTRLAAALARLVVDLSAERCTFAVVGGLAVSAWVEPRFTRDVDVAVAVSDDREAERLVRALEGRGYRVLFLAEHERAERLAQVRMCPPGETPDGIVVDLLFASSGIEPEIAGAARVLDLLPGVRAPVASAPHLVALKLLARDDTTRPQDAADLIALLATMDEGDAAEARAAVRLIAGRGFDRGRDLSAALEAALAAGR